MNLIERDDPRVRMNVDAIERELTQGPLVWRYLPHETDDGLAGQEEGAFTLLSFWLIGNLIYTGQNDRAMDFFHDVITTQANHLGLFRRDVRPDHPTSDRQLPPGLLPHRPHPHRPQPVRLHRRHAHPAAISLVLTVGFRRLPALKPPVRSPRAWVRLPPRTPRLCGRAFRRPVSSPRRPRSPSAPIRS